jgi:hypothetical protein
MVFSRRSVLGGTIASLAASTVTARFGAALAQGLSDAGQLEYQPLESVQNGGLLRGTLKYDGPPVEPVKMKVIKDTSTCGEGFRTVVPMRVSEGGALADAVIQIRGITTGKPWDPIFESAKIYQMNCSFQPFVQIVRSSAEAEIINFDPIMHNVHAYEVFEGTRRSMFNFVQPRAGQVDVISLKLRRGNLITIDCNAHNWMAAWIYTSPSPYLVVTSVDGLFEIGDIPAGNYQLSVWHPALGEKFTDFTVAPGETLDVDLVMS